MSSIIKKIKLINYKRFKNYTIEPKQRVNVLAGDNEVGKSSILEAIDIVSSGNIRKVESIGIDRLLNIVEPIQKQDDKAWSKESKDCKFLRSVLLSQAHFFSIGFKSGE